MRKANTKRGAGRGFSAYGAKFLLLLALAGPAGAAPKPSPPKAPPTAPPADKSLPPAVEVNDTVRAWPLPADRSTVLPARQPDAARLRQLSKELAFQYHEPTEINLGLSERFWRWLARLLDRLLGHLPESKAGRLTWKYAWYAAVVAVLVFAVLKFLQVDLTAIFRRNPRRISLGYEVLDEDIHGVDFPARITEAEDAGNYRLAIRLGYLEILKRLSDQGLIRWELNKTNQAYLHELPTGPLREAFRLATRHFEYVWYGELPLTAPQYAQVRADQRAVTSSPFAPA